MSTEAVTSVVADLLDIVPADDALSWRATEACEDHLLVDAAKAGDRQAFGRLVEVHEQAALRTAMAALGRREDAEDVAQEAFVVAWQKLRGFRGTATFKTWLLTIVWRRALDRRRSRARWWRQSAPLDVEHGSPAGRAAAEHRNPEQTALDRELTRRVAREIARLSPKLKDALLLSAAGEQSYEEIARMLGVRVGTVKWRVSEARRLLASRLGPPRDC